jgi:spermidine synthase
VVLSGLGVRTALVVAAALHLIACIALGFIAEARSGLRVLAPALAAAAVLMLSVGQRAWRPQIAVSGVFQNARIAQTTFESPEAFFRSLSALRILHYDEGATATVAVYEEPTLGPTRQISLAIDGKVDASTGDDMPTQLLLAHLPLLLHPSGAEDVAVIGWGSGITAGSALQHPIESLTAIEIEPAVVEASRHFDEFNHRPLSDPRLRVVTEDARTLLLREERQYDVIISEPSNPWLSGPSKLFTRDFLLTARSRLRPGGVFAQWIHLYGLDTPLLQMFLRTFHSVFPHLLVFQTAEGDLVLLGSGQPLTLHPQRINERLQEDLVRADMERIGVAEGFDILARFRFGEREIAERAGSGPLNTDDRPLLEFGAAKSLYRDTLSGNISHILGGFRSLMAYLPDGMPADVVTTAALRALRNGDEAAARMFARELPSSPASAQALWLKGELGQREHALPTFSTIPWGQALEAGDCWGCAVGLALTVQHQGNFAEAERILAATTRTSSPGSQLVGLLRGINLFYDADSAGSARLFQSVLQEPNAQPRDDIQAIVLKRIFPARVLAAFYLAEAASAAQPPQEDAASALAPELAAWRADLMRQAKLTSWAELLAAMEVHGQRAAAARVEQKLVALVAQQVLEPVAQYHSAVRHVQLGDLQAARRELEEIAQRFPDAETQTVLREALEKLDRWEAAQQ